MMNQKQNQIWKSMILLSLSLGWSLTRAEMNEEPLPMAQEEQSSVASEEPTLPKKQIRSKEAEGTQAPRGFDVSIPRSQYQINGQPLEVDPD